MALKDFWVEKKAAVLDRWLDRILEIYPVDSRNFFKDNKNPFSNPIGSTIREGIEKLYEEILQPTNPAKARSLLDPIIRVRAVENLSPSRAVAFVPLFKEAVKVTLEDRFPEEGFIQEWLSLDDKIDQLTLLAFDIYMECREKVYQLRLKEMRSRVGNIQEKGNPETPSWEGR